MKLSSLLPVAQALTVNDALGNPTDWVLTIQSPDCAARAEVENSIARTILQDPSQQQNPEFLRRSLADVQAACVSGWDGLTDDEGSPVPYTPAKAAELLSNPELTFVLKQVEGYTSERTNFFRPSTVAAD